MSRRFPALILLTLIAGCGKPASSDAGNTQQAAGSPPTNPVNPTAEPITNWVYSGPKTNAIDGTKTEFLSLESTDTVLTSVGDLRHAEINLCFDNGKLCRKSVGVGVSVHGMVAPGGYEPESQYNTPVRIKFDDDKPSRETWGIADSHDSLFPFGREEKFLLQLIRHKKFILEFSYYEKAPQTLTFEISGLDDKLKSIGIDIKAQAAARESSARQRAASEQEQKNAAIQAFMAEHTDVGKKIAAQIGHCKNANDFCWEPDDRSGPWGPFPTVAIAMKYAMEHYKDHSN